MQRHCDSSVEPSKHPSSSSKQGGPRSAYARITNDLARRLAGGPLAFELFGRNTGRFGGCGTTRRAAGQAGAHVGDDTRQGGYIPLVLKLCSVLFDIPQRGLIPLPPCGRLDGYLSHVASLPPSVSRASSSRPAPTVRPC